MSNQLPPIPPASRRKKGTPSERYATPKEKLVKIRIGLFQCDAAAAPGVGYSQRRMTLNSLHCFNNSY
jgi:hypothetical protein